MSERLQLVLFGGLRVRLGPRPLKGWIYTKAPALLAYLAVMPGAHSRDALAGLLWSDVPDADAKRYLRNVLHNLRQFLAPYLRVDRQTVEFDRDSPYTLDVEAFNALTGAARSGQSEASSSLSDLQAAVDLYGGDFLEGVYIRDAPIFEEWVLTRRERLRQLALHALYELTTAYAARGQVTPGINWRRDSWHWTPCAKRGIAN